MPALTARPGDLVLVADAHLGGEDQEIAAFCAFLEARAADAAELVLLGDIFSLWLGQPKYTQAHHRAVLERCRALRRAGARVVFIEGNREFAARCWQGDAFDEVAEESAAETWASGRWLLAHGDRMHRADWSGRAFRRAVRSGPARALLRGLPARWGLALGESLERALRTRRLRFKTALAPGRLLRYATWLARRGFDGGVIGHLHIEEEHRLVGPDGVARSLYVVPDWRGTKRFLRIPRDGAPRFEAFGSARPAAPAVLEVREASGQAEVILDRDAGFAVGATLVVHSGHSALERRGAVLRVVEGEPRRLVLTLSAGPPLRVGDRLVLDAPDAAVPWEERL